jgi:monovalent cation:H+ antiporter-2, CPA2 family
VHTASLFLELGAIVFGLGVLGRVAHLVGMSPIPLYLLAGLAFGRGGLFPLTTSGDFLSSGARIGVILLLLLLGLEYTAEELMANLRAQAPAGVVNIALNATPGAVAAVLLGWSPVAAVAMAGVTYASSSGIAAKLLTDLGRLGNRETPVVLSLLVLEDLSMAFYLPIMTALVAGAGPVRGLVAEVVAGGTVIAVLVVAVRFGGVINRLVFSPDDEVLLLRVLGLALIVAGVAEQLQVSSAVGAFLVGIALSGEVAAGARALMAPLRDLFAAVFFVFFGLDTDPALIPPVLLPALLLAAVTAATKVATGWWAARRAGVGPRGRIRAGTVIVARGEFNIVIAGLAVASERRLGPLAAAYVLVLAVAGPVLARLGEPMAARWLPPAGAERSRVAPPRSDPSPG